MTDYGAPSFVLALAQMRVDPDARDANLQRALRFVDQAARSGADIVLLPEALPVGWMGADTHAGADAIPDGPTCLAFRQTAQDAGVYICTGLVERAGSDLFNAAVLIDPAGDVVLHHRKINELDIAHALYARGDRLGVAATPWGRMGVMICADAFADRQVVSRTLGLMGADVILSPCAWAVSPDHDNARHPYGQLWRDSYGPVARDCQLWIAGASSVGPMTSGPWRGHACIGCSLVVAPTGSAVLEGPYGADAEALLVTRVAPRPVRPAAPVPIQ